MKPDLIAIIEEQERLALSGGRLQEDRIEAMDAYLGRPYGDEEEGRSQIVMRDVADTVEWIIPSLMKVFCSGDEVVVFNPVGPEDEEQAEQETDYCNHVLMQRNAGFLVLHDWFKDALLQKNGYVLASQHTENRDQRSAYEGLTDDEFASLAGGDVELVEHTERMVVDAGPNGMPVAYTLHDAVVVSKQEYRCIKVTNIPPERVLIARDWPNVSLEGCPFVEVIDYKTVSELRQDGLDVPDDISDETNSDGDFAEQNRRVTDDGSFDHEDLGADAATKRLKTRYVWMLVDKDGDGKAELRKFVVVGRTILDEDEDDLIPVACAVPYRMPHEHNGLSVHDFVEDIQRIRTALVRGFLDNMYLVNNPRHAVDATLVNVDDLLSPARAGGIVRVGSVDRPLGVPISQTMMPLVQPADSGSILQSIEYMDTVRENRTGVTKYNQGLDANSLNKTAHGMQQVMNASQQRIELIARILAETGVKTLMLIIHAMSLKHTRQAEMVKLRNKWVEVDPTSWKTRRDLTVSVGLGTGNKDQMLQHLQMILMAQKEAIPLGLVSKKNVYNALAKLTQNAGFKLPDEYWTEPQDQEGEQAIQLPGDPNAAKAQADMQKTQMQLTADQQKFQAESQLKAQEQERQMMFDASEKEKDRQAELEKVRIQAAKDIEIARMGQASAMQAKAADHEFQAATITHQAQREDQSKQAEKTQIETVIGELQEMVKGLAEQASKPLSIIRGKDGRAAMLQ